MVRGSKLEKLRLQDFRTLLTSDYLGFLPCVPSSNIPVLSRNQPGAQNTVERERSFCSTFGPWKPTAHPFVHGDQWSL